MEAVSGVNTFDPAVLQSGTHARRVVVGHGSLEDSCVRDLPVRVHQDRWGFDGFERRLLIDVVRRIATGELDLAAAQRP